MSSSQSYVVNTGYMEMQGCWDLYLLPLKEQNERGGLSAFRDPLMPTQRNDTTVNALCSAVSLWQRDADVLIPGTSEYAHT